MIDVTGPTWPDVKEWASEKVEDGRDTLENINLPEKQRNFECGYLAALRDLLDLPKKEKS